PIPLRCGPARPHSLLSATWTEKPRRIPTCGRRDTSTNAARTPLRGGVFPSSDRHRNRPCPGGIRRLDPAPVSEEPTVIEVRNLSKRYGSTPAVQGLSFEVPKGQICGFLGPNGAGKSTTLRMLTGFLAPSEGAIRIGGIDALTHPVEARKKIGY